MVPKHIVDIAYKEANKSKMRFKLGAIVYDKNYKILGRGHNRWYRTSKKMYGLKMEGNVPRLSIHAEVDAINHVRKDERHKMFGIYVFRKNNRIAKPCMKCQQWINKNGIKKINWSDRD